MRLLPSIPSLQELHLTHNALTKLTHVGVFTNLVVLDFESNQLDWKEIHKLSHLSKLQKLNVTNNPIQSVSKAAADEWKGIQMLSIGGCSIDGWKSIDNLNSWPALTVLRFLNTPVHHN